MPNVEKANSNINNCLKDEELNEVLAETCDFIYQVLSEHCGPCSEYAFIKDVTQELDDGTFTKDGINIVRSLSFYTPIQASLKKAIAHIGSCVERAAADGTTSSMMIAIYALKEMRNNKTIRRIPTARINRIWSYIEQLINKRYKNGNPYVITVKDILCGCGLDEHEAIERIAYSQTYTSSHGDIHLANTVKELFVNTPRDAWSTIQVRRADYETDKPFEIEYDHTQWSFERFGIAPFSERLSENLEGILKRDDEHCVICQIPPLANGDVDSIDLLNKIKTSIVDKEEITYIVPNKIDGFSKNVIDTTMHENPDHKTTVIFVSPDEEGTQYDTEIMPLMFENYNGEQLLNCTLSYETNGKYFHITKGIYNFPDIDLSVNCITHPWVGDGKHTLYNDYVSQLKRGIENSQKQFELSKVNKKWYEHIKKVLTKISVINRITFVVGGSLYTNLTAVDIVHDTLPAVKRSLENGFCLGGNKSLFKALEDITDNLTDKEKEMISDEDFEVIKDICNIFKNAIIEVNNAICFNTNPDKKPSIKSFNADICSDIMSDDKYNLRDCICNNIPFVIQPIETDLELLKRFGEMMIRFVKTNKMISEGTMIDK